MKLSKSKKIILSGLMATAGLGIAGAAVIPTLTSSHQVSSGSESTSSGSSSSTNSTDSTIKTTVTSSQGYSFTLMSNTEETDGSTSTDPSTATYTITIQEGTIKEGQVYLIDKDGKQVTSLDFKPGDEIKVQMVLNSGYSDYTVRDFNLTGSDPSVFIPSKNDPKDKTMFTIQMPKYEDTVNPLTGKSDVYAEGTPFVIRPTFIKESIGNAGYDVNWQHGAFADSLNGYVYDLTGNMNWSDVKTSLYTTFENKEITNPIDVYIYLHGYNLTLDQDQIDLGIKSGWAIHIYNNSTDSKESTIKTGMNADGYGEIKVPEGKEAHVAVGGSIALGGGVKYKFIPWSDGIAFISYNDTRWIGYQSNDPVERLGA